MNIEQKITSMEVAEMVGKEHKELLRDIRKYCEQMEEANKNSNERKIALVDFFTESNGFTSKRTKNVIAITATMIEITNKPIS